MVFDVYNGARVNKSRRKPVIFFGREEKPFAIAHERLSGEL
jgi:hypothetical protein